MKPQQDSGNAGTDKSAKHERRPAPNLNPEVSEPCRHLSWKAKWFQPTCTDCGRILTVQELERLGAHFALNNDSGSTTDSLPSSDPLPTNTSEPELYEKLAAIEHERWSAWQRWVHDEAGTRVKGGLYIDPEYIDRWERQINTPYSELSPQEKESDRQQVDRYWPLIQEHIKAKAALSPQSDSRPNDGTDAKVEPKSEIEAKTFKQLIMCIYQTGRDYERGGELSVVELELDEEMEQISALIDKAVVAELAGLKAQYKELYNLSLIHGGAYEDCLSDFAYQEISDVINRRLAELESGDKE